MAAHTPHTDVVDKIDDALRLLEDYERETTSKFVVLTSPKNFGNSGECFLKSMLLLDAPFFEDPYLLRPTLGKHILERELTLCISRSSAVVSCLLIILNIKSNPDVAK